MWGEWVRRLGLGFTIPVETGGVWGVCLCLGCGGVGGVGRGAGAWWWLGPGSARMGLCYVAVCCDCESGLFV